AAVPTPQRAGATCARPGDGYNADGSCYDERPAPLAPTFVPLTDEVEGTPRASILWVRVSPDGRTLEVQPRTPSNDPAFERLAQEYALKVRWEPATRGGRPVEGWTQWIFPPLGR
ncbi:MAG TPA: energy transducer TonB, partial [Gemmatimonadales bacterium]|nr:energy transducer TonB [Gemmatimonadales bacterium]